MSTDNGTIPAITHSAATIDAASHKPDLARQLISARSGQDGGIIAQLSANPFFTAVRIAPRRQSASTDVTDW